MGLAQCQTLLAKLATDAVFRARFLRDPQAVGAELGLSPEEAILVAQLPARQVGRFAESLRNKRYQEVKQLLPLSHLALGDAAFARLFNRHASLYVPVGVRKHRDDAVAFARSAEHTIRQGEVRPDWAADALRYEATRLVAADAGQCCIVCWLRHSIDHMVSCARSRGAAPPSRRVLAIWFRITPAGRSRHLVAALPCPTRGLRT